MGLAEAWRAVLTASEESQLPMVLLVEDDPGQRALIERAFQSETEARLCVAQTLHEGRTILARQLPDLVLADWQLPDGLGIELADGPLETARYPVVVMTAHGDEYVAVEAMRAGAIDYVIKTSQALREMPRIAHRALREWRRVLDHRHAERARRMLEEQRHQNQHKAAITSLAIGAARELQHLLQTVSAQLSDARQLFTDGADPGEAFDKIDLATQRGEHLAARLLSVGGERPSCLDTVQPGKLLEQVIEQLVSLTHSDAFELDIQKDLPWLRVDPAPLHQAIVQLGLNALEAGASRITARCRLVVSEGPNPNVVLELIDNGPGMTPNVLVRAKDPLFTTKFDGTGLGLTMAEAVVKAAGGELMLESHVGRGLTCRIVLPGIAS